MTTHFITKGSTQTILQNNNHKESSQMQWNADYNGNIANIHVNTNTNGKKQKYQMKFTNKDLADILSIPSINEPLEQRLQQDFLGNLNPNSDKEDNDDLFEPEPILFQMSSQPMSSTNDPRIFTPSPITRSITARGIKSRKNNKKATNKKATNKKTTNKKATNKKATNKKITNKKATNKAKKTKKSSTIKKYLSKLFKKTF